jgi:hypothetical protein
MANKPRRRRKAPDLETNPSPDLLPDELRRRDPPQTPPDSMPPDEEVAEEEDPVGGGFTPRIDGGNEQHPVHDEDQEDATPEDYEREIDRLDQAIRVGSDKKF